MDCLVSIVVLTYNHEHYIREALDSILMQNVPYPIEILIGDDASTDNTPTILCEYKQKYPNLLFVFLRQKNIGASKNLYHLLQHATGKYIALLEGDDYWTDTNKLTTQIDFLETNPSYSACTHSCSIIDAQGTPLPHQKKGWLSEKEHFSLTDCKGFYLSGQTGTLVFRNIFKDPEHNYDVIFTAHPLISDRTLQTILTAIGPIYHFKKSMSVYRNQSSTQKQNATSIVFENNPRSPLENFQLTCVLKNYILNEFHMVLPCESIKRMFFSIALFKAIIKPSREHFNVFISIFLDPETKKIQYLFLFPFEILKRVLFRLKERF